MILRLFERKLAAELRPTRDRNDWAGSKLRKMLTATREVPRWQAKRTMTRMGRSPGRVGITAITATIITAVERLLDRTTWWTRSAESPSIRT